MIYKWYCTSEYTEKTISTKQLENSAIFRPFLIFSYKTIRFHKMLRISSPILCVKKQILRTIKTSAEKKIFKFHVFVKLLRVLIERQWLILRTLKDKCKLSDYKTTGWKDMFHHNVTQRLRLGMTIQIWFVIKWTQHKSISSLRKWWIQANKLY